MKTVLWGLVGAIAAIGAVLAAQDRGLDSYVGSLLALAAMFSVAGAIYVLPALIADYRAHRNGKAIAALTLLGGWTVIGWLGALVWALTNNIDGSVQATPSGKLVAKLSGLAMLPVGVFLVGMGLKSFASLSGMMARLRSAETGSLAPYLPGWIPVIGGVVLIALSLYLLARRPRARLPEA